MNDLVISKSGLPTTKQNRNEYGLTYLILGNCSYVIIISLTNRHSKYTQQVG